MYLDRYRKLTLCKAFKISLNFLEFRLIYNIFTVMQSYRPNGNRIVQLNLRTIFKQFGLVAPFSMTVRFACLCLFIYFVCTFYSYCCCCCFRLRSFCCIFFYYAKRTTTLTITIYFHFTFRLLERASERERVGYRECERKPDYLRLFLSVVCSTCSCSPSSE